MGKVPEPTIEYEASTLRCAYVDQTFSDLHAIAELHEQLSADPPTLDSRSLLIHTCERVEVYSVGPSPPDLVNRIRQVLDVPPTLLTDRLEVLRRLTEIATGVRSRLLGERFVYEQVQRAVLAQANDHMLFDEGITALRIARAARAHHRFNAEFDYPELAADLLRNHNALPPPAGVFIVGGGMLAQAIATQPWILDYEQRAIMTRSPKKLRRRFPDRPEGVAIVSPRQVSAVTMDSWDLVIATVNITDTYRSTVELLVHDERCRLAVDLSSVPLYNSNAPAHYTGLYGTQVKDLMELHNLSRRETAAAVRAYVRDALDRVLAEGDEGAR